MLWWGLFLVGFSVWICSAVRQSGGIGALDVQIVRCLRACLKRAMPFVVVMSIVGAVDASSRRTAVLRCPVVAFSSSRNGVFGMQVMPWALVGLAFVAMSAAMVARMACLLVMRVS